MPFQTFLKKWRYQVLNHSEVFKFRKSRFDFRYFRSNCPSNFAAVNLFYKDGCTAVLNSFMAIYKRQASDVPPLLTLIWDGNMAPRQAPPVASI